MENAQRDAELQLKTVTTCALGMENELLPSSLQQSFMCIKRSNRHIFIFFPHNPCFSRLLIIPIALSLQLHLHISLQTYNLLKLIIVSIWHDRTLQNEERTALKTD